MDGNFAFKKCDCKGERGKELPEENISSRRFVYFIFVVIFVCYKPTGKRLQDGENKDRNQGFPLTPPYQMH